MPVILIFEEACPQSITEKLLIYTGCFTNYIVLIIYCLISVCMENSFCGLYIQKSKTNITELSGKEGCDRNRRYQQNATSCSQQISCVNKMTLLKQKSARVYLQLHVN